MRPARTALSALLFALAGTAAAADFTAGDLVVYRSGDGCPGCKTLSGPQCS